MGEAVYAIDEFPDDDLLWRIDWVAGVGYNTNVPSDPLLDFCLEQIPTGAATVPQRWNRLLPRKFVAN